MKHLLVLAVVSVLVAVPSIAQEQQYSPFYMIGYFSNNPGPGGPADQQIRLVNFGATGTPLTSPVGDVCANVYVFDANQEMVSCCSCRITPNALLTLSVANGLTNNPVTSVVPINGDVKILSTSAEGSTPCSPLSQNGGFLNSTAGFNTHLQVSGGTAGGMYLTETKIIPSTISYAEYTFLLQACQYARYLGSNKGVCACK